MKSSPSKKATKTEEPEPILEKLSNCGKVVPLLLQTPDGYLISATKKVMGVVPPQPLIFSFAQLQVYFRHTGDLITEKQNKILTEIATLDKNVKSVFQSYSGGINDIMKNEKEFRKVALLDYEIQAAQHTILKVMQSLAVVEKIVNDLELTIAQTDSSSSSSSHPVLMTLPGLYPQLSPPPKQQLQDDEGKTKQDTDNDFKRRFTQNSHT